MKIILLHRCFQVSRLWHGILLLLSLAFANHTLAQTQPSTLHGSVIDAKTLEPLAGVLVYYPGTNKGTSTDIQGKFSISILPGFKSITIAYSGFHTHVLHLPSVQTSVIIKLHHDINQLQEVVVTTPRKKDKYRNKNNPAVDLVQNIIDNKKSNSLGNNPHIQFEQYEKTQLSFVNTPEKIKNNLLLRKYSFLTSTLDTLTLAPKALLPVYLQEVISDNQFHKDPTTHTKVVKAEKKVDFGEYIDNNGVASMIRYMYQDVDVYDNNILILTNQFLSPIADLAPAFYKYYLGDTIATQDGQKYATIYFSPRNEAAFTFIGKLLVSLDGQFAVKSMELKVGKNVNINWVRNLTFTVNYDKQNDGHYLLTKSQMRTELSLGAISDAGFFGERIVSHKSYQFNSIVPTATDLNEKNKEQMHAPNDEKYWASIRHDSLTTTELKTYSNVDSLTNLKSFKRLMDWGTALLAGYKRLGSKVEIGPLNTFYSFNPIEGLRLRFGGRTTTIFSKKVMVETYAAYGFRDSKWKCYLGGIYSLTDRSIFQFPVRSIKASIHSDMKIPGQDLQFVQEDNLLLSFKRGQNDKWLYNKTHTLEYLHEFRNHFSFKVGFKNWHQTPTGSLVYAKDLEKAEGAILASKGYLSSSEAVLELRWAPNEQFFQGKLYRTRVVNKYPVITLRSTSAVKGIFAAQYTYQSTFINVAKRFYLSQLGYTDVVTEAGLVLGQVPFPLLMMHRANQTYAYQAQSYNLMNFLEFVSDQYTSLHVDHAFNGFLFNKIPVLKKTKLREYVTLKVLYGKVREENQPEKNAELFRLPTFKDGQTATYSLEKKPYVEASIGIGNILNFFRIDVVKRLTYLDHPYVSDLGIRGRFKFDF